MEAHDPQAALATPTTEEQVAAVRRREAETVVADCAQRADTVTNHILRAAVMLARVAPEPGRRLVDDLDAAITENPDLEPDLRSLRAAVAAELDPA